MLDNPLLYPTHLSALLQEGHSVILGPSVNAVVRLRLEEIQVPIR